MSALGYAILGLWMLATMAMIGRERRRLNNVIRALRPCGPVGRPHAWDYDAHNRLGCPSCGILMPTTRDGQ